MDVVAERGRGTRLERRWIARGEDAGGAESADDIVDIGVVVIDSNRQVPNRARLEYDTDGEDLRGFRFQVRISAGSHQFLIADVGGTAGWNSRADALLVLGTRRGDGTAGVSDGRRRLRLAKIQFADGRRAERGGVGAANRHVGHRRV